MVAINTTTPSTLLQEGQKRRISLLECNLDGLKLTRVANFSHPTHGYSVSSQTLDRFCSPIQHFPQAVCRNPVPYLLTRVI